MADFKQLPFLLMFMIFGRCIITLFHKVKETTNKNRSTKFLFLEGLSSSDSQNLNAWPLETTAPLTIAHLHTVKRSQMISDPENWLRPVPGEQCMFQGPTTRPLSKSRPKHPVWVLWPARLLVLNALWAGSVGSCGPQRCEN